MAVGEKAVVELEVVGMVVAGMAEVAAKEKEVEVAGALGRPRERSEEAAAAETRVAVSKGAAALEAVERVAAVKAEVAMAVAALEVVDSRAVEATVHGRHQLHM